MGSEAVRPIQQALKSQGLESGGIDGIWGATPLPQSNNSKCEVDGIVGPQTTAALFKDVPSAIESLLPWFEEAKHLMDAKEVLDEGY